MLAHDILERPSVFTNDVVDRMREIARRDLAPIVPAIDREGLYPDGILRAFGQAGAYRSHLPDGDIASLADAIRGEAAAGEQCLSTSFCMWCQNALAWYVFCSDNEPLKATLGREVASGRVLGGTGLSNPMKTFFGIETMRLKARRTDGGFVVTGSLPWVSNLGPDHWFGCVFEVEGKRNYWVMAAVPCDAPGLTLSPCGEFLALDGTGTYAVRFRDVMVPDGDVLADPIDAYLKCIRAGFVLMQTGMGIGLIRGCIELIRRTERTLGHVNRFLDRQAADIEGDLERLEATALRLAATPFETDPGYWREVIACRLACSEQAVEAAHQAMLHSGARGFVAGGPAQRRLRESYFVAIVTPATKQLKKMLAEMTH